MAETSKTYDLAFARILTIVVALLMGIISLAGLIFPDSIYPSPELIQSFMANDVINLVIGLPILLGSIWLTQREKLVGLLCWPGALLYVLYNYIAYAVGIPFSWPSLVFLALILLSVYTIFHLLKRIDKEPVQMQLAGAVPEKFSGWVLLIFGILFSLRAIGMLAQGYADQIALPVSELGVLIADIILSAFLITGGVLLLQKRPLGYVCGLGLFFVASMLFVGLIAVLLLQPVLTEAQFMLTDIVVVFSMGLICFIPFALFLRGALSSEKFGEGDEEYN